MISEKMKLGGSLSKKVGMKQCAFGRDALLRIVDEHWLDQLQSFAFHSGQNGVQNVVSPGGKAALVVGEWRNARPLFIYWSAQSAGEFKKSLEWQ